MDGDGVSSRDGSDIGRLRPGSDNDTTDDHATNDHATNDHTIYREAAGRDAKIWRRDDYWPCRGYTGF